MAGVGTVEACQQIGITRKTGYRWRAERGGLPPLRMFEKDRGPRYLVFAGASADRDAATYRPRGAGDRPRTGSLPVDGVAGNCDVTAVPMMWAATTATSRTIGQALQGQVQASELGWSPEQIAAWLRRPIPTGVPGISVTRRSTRPSITAGVVP